LTFTVVVAFVSFGDFDVGLLAQGHEGVYWCLALFRDEDERSFKACAAGDYLSNSTVEGSDDEDLATERAEVKMVVLPV
jgi:hypothetical protein